jgi:4-hydroxy-tetrahydrodipicolinate synthase
MSNMFAGNIVALVTPFRNGALDAAALKTSVDRVIEGGVSALVPCGTTGESPTLTHDEHDAVVALTVEAANGRVPVIAGAGSNSTAEAIRLTKAAAAAGAAAVLSVNPYYNRPSQAGLVQHFLAIADASDVPIVLYNIPSRCGVELSLETIARLAAHPRIRAIKEATGNVENVTRIRATTDLAVLAGDDALALPMMALGATGVISVLSNLMPGAMTRLVHAAAAGDLARARAEHDRLHPLMKMLFVETNPAPVKAAMAHVGWILPELRAPLCPLADANRAQLERALAPFREEIR